MEFILLDLGCSPGASTANCGCVVWWIIGSFPENNTNQPTDQSATLPTYNLCHFAVLLICETVNHVLSMVYKIPEVSRVGPLELLQPNSRPRLKSGGFREKVIQFLAAEAVVQMLSVGISMGVRTRKWQFAQSEWRLSWDIFKRLNRKRTSQAGSNEPCR